MAETRKCQRCENESVASVTGQVDRLFGFKWPGGKIQRGYVLPHDLIGLRENEVGKQYLNFSYCLVCGQIQGEWPTKVGQSYMKDTNEHDENSEEVNCDEVSD